MIPGMVKILLEVLNMFNSNILTFKSDVDWDK